jgi:hypothetical protein
MLEERKARQTTDPVHLGFNEQRQPLLRGDAYHYLIARGDLASDSLRPILLSKFKGCLTRLRAIRRRRLSR